MSAQGITIVQETNDIAKQWRELWYGMADGDAKQYEVIKALDIREFWAIFDVWSEKVKQKLSAIRNNKQ